MYVEANVLKISTNEAYSMLLTHEARLESNHSNATKETKLNFIANMAQTGNNQKKSGDNTSWNANNKGNWNGNFMNKSGNGNYNSKWVFGFGRGGYMEQNLGRA